jgi:hypothetical protein
VLEYEHVILSHKSPSAKPSKARKICGAKVLEITNFREELSIPIYQANADISIQQ